MRARIPKRKRIFLGCEGQSEQSYGAFLQLLADEDDLAVHIHAVVFVGGDPLAIVKEAADRVRRASEPYAFRAVLLDRDRFGLTPARDNQIPLIARQSSLELIWQDTCHEGFLLRHMPGQEHRRPASTQIAHRELRAVWPDYEKGMLARDIRRTLDKAAVVRAAGVEAKLAALLAQIGLR